MGKTEQDLRFQRTTQSIQNAMVELLQEKQFDQITVSDICSRAEISRSGFYLHYMDKYDLVASYQRELMGKGMALIDQVNQMGIKTVLLEILHILTSEGRMLSLLLSSHGSTEIQIQMKQMVRENALKNVLPHLPVVLDTEVQKNYFVVFIVNAVFGVLQEWVNSGQKESPEELMAVVEKLLPFSLK